MLDKHALHMQALRRRQQQERELLEAKLRDKRAERLLKLRAQRDGEEDENSKTNERPKSAAKPAPVPPAIISSIEFVKKNGKNGSTDSLSNTSNSSSSGEMANKHSSQTQSGESGFITGPHSDSEDSDTDGDASDNELVSRISPKNVNYSIYVFLILCSLTHLLFIPTILNKK